MFDLLFGKKKDPFKGPVTYMGEGFKIEKSSVAALEKLPPYRIELPDEYRKRHLWGFGTTGVGKTRLIELMLEQDIAKGYSVIILDPKGDSELLAKVYYCARAAGRLDDMILVNPIFPECSAMINPLSSYFMPEELVAHIVSGVDVNGEKFFYNVAQEITMAVVMSSIMIAEKEKRPLKFVLQDVKNLISKTDLGDLKAQLDLIDNDKARQLAKDVQKIYESPQDYYGKISSSLRVALGELCSGNIGEVVGTARTNPIIDRLESKKTVITVVQLGSLITNQAAYTVGKIILSMIKAFVGRSYAANRKLSPPLMIYADEAQNILFMGLEDLLAKAGSANVGFHGFCQSVNQIYAQVGQEIGRSILDNTNTKLFYRVPDDETAEYVTRHFGKRWSFQPTMTTSGKSIFAQSELPVLDPTDVMDLQPRDFFMMSYHGRYKVKAGMVNPAPIDLVYPTPDIKSTV